MHFKENWEQWEKLESAMENIILAEKLNNDSQFKIKKSINTKSFFILKNDEYQCSVYYSLYNYRIRALNEEISHSIRKNAGTKWDTVNSKDLDYIIKILLRCVLND